MLSTPAVAIPSHTQPRPSTSVPLREHQLRHVNIGGTSYIPSHIPSSSQPIPSNSFLMHPLPNSSGPLGQILTVSHVHLTSANTVVSKGQVPPSVSAGHIPTSGLSHGTSRGPSHGLDHRYSHIPNDGPSYGTCHGPSHGSAYGASHGPSYG